MNQSSLSNQTPVAATPLTAWWRNLHHRATPMSVNVPVVVTVVTLTTMLAPLNSTMIAVALPQIMATLHVDLGRAGWLVTAYLIAMAALQPVAGKLGDQWGRRRLILGGLAYFGVVSLGALAANQLWLLLFFRVQQALAAAIALPNGMALIRELVPTQQRGRYLGLIGAATSFAAACGPALGGLLVGLLGWRAIFSVNLLLVVPALLVGWQVIPNQRRAEATGSFDLLGAILLSVTLSGLAWLLIAQRQVTTLLNAPLLIGGPLLLALMAGFFWYEARHNAPLLPVHFFRASTFAAANSAVATSNLAMYVTLLALPLLLSQRAGWSSTQTGLLLAAMSGMTALFAPWGGRLADQLGRRRPTVIGLTLFTLGLAPLAWTGGAVGMGWLVASLALTGIGLGISSAGLQTAALEAVPAGQAGTAAGLFSTSRYLGSIVGSAVLTLLLATSSGFTAVFCMVIVAAALSAIASLGIADSKR